MKRPLLPPELRRRAFKRYSTPLGSTKKTALMAVHVQSLVAGPGFAPRPPDYEPGEVLFLHPALNIQYDNICRKPCQSGKIRKIDQSTCVHWKLDQYQQYPQPYRTHHQVHFLPQIPVLQVLPNPTCF
jgi:hypothetical protein